MGRSFSSQWTGPYVFGWGPVRSLRGQGLFRVGVGIVSTSRSLPPGRREFTGGGFEDSGPSEMIRTRGKVPWETRVGPGSKVGKGLRTDADRGGGRSVPSHEGLVYRGGQ